jgi:hypothetical protein
MKWMRVMSGKRWKLSRLDIESRSARRLLGAFLYRWSEKLSAIRHCQHKHATSSKPDTSPPVYNRGGKFDRIIQYI